MNDPQTTIPWDEIDEGIRGPLRVLHEAGVDTISSCQGGGYGMGHGYRRPTITFDGDDETGARAEKIVENAGYVVFQLVRRYIGGKPAYWQLEFMEGAAHGR